MYSNYSNPSSRRSSESGNISRKKSLILDYAGTTRALNDAKIRLLSTTTQLDELSKACTELASRHTALLESFEDMKNQSLDCTWRYCLDKSSDFTHIPQLDYDLVETDNRVGPYVLSEVLGQGHFSVVRGGKLSDKDFTKGGVDRSRLKSYNIPKSKYSSSFMFAKRQEEYESNNVVGGIDFGAMGTSDMVKNSLVGKNIIIEAELELDEDIAAQDSSFNQTTQKSTNSVDVGNNKLAIKIIKKDLRMSSISNALAIEREIKALKLLSPHPNIVAFERTLHGTQALYIVTERFKQDLFSFIDDNKHLINPNIAATILRELFTAVAYLAQHNMVHRDIKPENVLIQTKHSHIIVKLCDFGLSEQLETGKREVGHFSGSPGFFAPEILLTRTYDAFKADIFSCACVALELLVGQSFFTKVWMHPYISLKEENQNDSGFNSQSTQKLSSNFPDVKISQRGTQDSTNTLGIYGKNSDKTINDTGKGAHVPLRKNDSRVDSCEFYQNMRQALLKSHREIYNKYPDNMACHEFFTCVLHIQPTVRPDATTLLSLPWLSKANKARACTDLLNQTPHAPVQSHTSLLQGIARNRDNLTGGGFNSINPNASGNMNNGKGSNVSSSTVQNANGEYAYSSTYGGFTARPRYLPYGIGKPSIEQTNIAEPTNIAQDIQAENKKCAPSPSPSPSSRRMSTAFTGSACTAQELLQNVANNRAGIGAMNNHAGQMSPQSTNDSITENANSIPRDILRAVNIQANNIIVMRNNGLGSIGRDKDEYRRLSESRRKSYLEITSVAPSRRDSSILQLSENHRLGMQLDQMRRGTVLESPVVNEPLCEDGETSSSSESGGDTDSEQSPKS